MASGALTADVEASEMVIIGEDRDVLIDVTAPDENGVEQRLDMTGYTLEWRLSQSVLGSRDVFIEKATGDGITLESSADPPDATLDRAKIALSSGPSGGDWNEARPGVASHYLRRTNVGQVHVLARGQFVLNAPDVA